MPRPRRIRHDVRVDDKSVMTPRILWAAIFGSTFIYLVVLELTGPPAEPSWPATSLYFAAAGFGTAVMSLVGPKLLVRSGPPRSETDTPEGRFLTGMILGMALADAVAIYGWIQGLFGAPVRVVMPYFITAWILMLMRFPTREKMGG